MNKDQNNPLKSATMKDKIIGLVVGLIIILVVMYFWF